jgi:hypothetical protein
MSRKSRDPVAQRKALAMLAMGYSPAVVARLAGASRQLVNGWARIARVNWQGIAWHNALRDWRQVGKTRKSLPLTKRQLRRRAQRAKAQWDKTHVHHY